MNARGKFLLQAGWILFIVLAATTALAAPLPRPLRSYGADLTTTGCAISGGDWSGEPASQAFDNNTGLRWGSSQNTPGIAGVSWIGCNFGSAKAIEQVRITPYGSSADNFVGNIAVQYCDTDCTGAGTWTTISQIAPTDTSTSQAFQFSYSGGHQYWRLRASINPTQGTSRWLVREVEMMEGTIDYGADITTTGCAISGGDHSGEPASQAFDNAFTTGSGARWGSSQTTPGIIETAWIGCDFGSAKHIERVTVTPYGSAAANHVGTVAVQYCDTDCTGAGVWTTAAVITPADTHTTQGFTISYAGSHQYWRLLAAVNPTTGTSYWIYSEVEMMERSATPTPTNTSVLSATPTGTLTPSVTPTATNTLTPTPDLYAIITVTSGPAVAIQRTATYGDMGIFMALSCITVLFIIGATAYLTGRLTSARNN